MNNNRVLLRCVNASRGQQTNKQTNPLTCRGRACRRRLVSVAGESRRRHKRPRELIHLDSCVAEGSRGMANVFGLLAVDGAVCVCAQLEPRDPGEVSLNMHNCKQETLFGWFSRIEEEKQSFPNFWGVPELVKPIVGSAPLTVVTSLLGSRFNPNPRSFPFPTTPLWFSDM